MKKIKLFFLRKGEIKKGGKKRAKNPQMTSKGTGVLKENKIVREKQGVQHKEKGMKTGGGIVKR